jgi:hypothetical protein
MSVIFNFVFSFLYIYIYIYIYIYTIFIKIDYTTNFISIYKYLFLNSLLSLLQVLNNAQ